MSLDNYVYGVLTSALDLYPFHLIKRMVLDTTYLYGIKTLQVFGSSKDIEELIKLTTNSVLKPLFLKDNTSGSVITTQEETDKKNENCYTDISQVLITTQNILEQYDNISKTNAEDEFSAFCINFIEEYETSRLIDKTFENIQDADMMIQCNNILNDFVQDVLIN